MTPRWTNNRVVRGSSIFAKPKGAGAKQSQLIASTHGCDGFCRLKWVIRSMGWYGRRDEVSAKTLTTHHGEVFLCAGGSATYIITKNCITSYGAAPQNAYSSGSAPHLSLVIRFEGYFSTTTRYSSKSCTAEHAKMCRGVIPRQFCWFPVGSNLLRAAWSWPDLMFIVAMRLCSTPWW